MAAIYSVSVDMLNARLACMHAEPEASQEYDICQAGVARTSLHVGDTKQGRSIALRSNSPQLCKECAQILEAQEKLPVQFCSSCPSVCPSCHACTCPVWTNNTSMCPKSDKMPGR